MSKQVIISTIAPIATTSFIASTNTCVASDNTAINAAKQLP